MAARLIGVPLMVHELKLHVVLAAVGARFGLDVGALPEAVEPQAKRRIASSIGGDPDAGIRYRLVEGVAVLPAMGTLVKRNGMDPSSGMVGVDGLTAKFRTALHDPNVTSILWQIDSGGGEVSGIFDLADEVYAARGEKPIWAVADEAAFSAAYLLASAAERVFLPRTAGVGSVGVIAVHVDQSQADAAAGRKYEIVKAGARKADFNPHAPLSEEARAILQAEVDRLQDIFVQTIARNRGLSMAAVRATEAGCFEGEHAVAAGLADGVETFDDTLLEFATRPGVSTTTRRLTMETDKKPEATAEASNVIQIDAARREGTETGRKLERERVDAITQLGLLAGFPTQAAELIASGATVDDARTALVDAKAKAPQGEPIHNHQPAATTSAGTLETPTVVYARRATETQAVAHRMRGAA